ncbi:MAG: DivIVA domain-containing protein [Clostridiales bacterium]|nr:DivIVA domain-containing protein [Clostridiales bacterium]
MITPFDIEKKEFSKGVRGYNIEEVDEFLDQIIVDLEKLMKENLRLKTEVATLEQENEKFKGSEGEVVKVLEQARSLMGDISASAEKRAEVLMKNAELDAELTVREARDRAERLKEENKTLQKRYIMFRDRYKRYLEEELDRFNTMDDDLFPMFDEGRLEDLVNAPLGANTAEPQPAAAPKTGLQDESAARHTLVAGELDTLKSEEDVPDTKERRTLIMDPATFEK